MIKLNIGCGGNILKGWSNMDREFSPPNYVDISKPLAFRDNSVDRIFAEHVAEHEDSPTAFKFFQECHRILKPKGAIRICVPSITRIWKHRTQEYLDWSKKAGFTDGTREGAVRSIILGHGHKSVWDSDILCVMLKAAGFNMVTHEESGESTRPEFSGIDGHGKVIGEENNRIETIVAEAVKR